MQNPLRSEADAFRWIVVIGIGAATVIVLTLLTRPAIGVAWAAALVGFAAGVAWRGSGGAGSRGGGSLLGADRNRTLVLAGDGVELATLLAGIEQRGADAAAEVFLVVPRPGRSPEAPPGLDAEAELARQRLELLLQGIEETGRKARGRLADSDPGVALTEALRDFGPDEVVVVGPVNEAARRV